MNVGPEAARLVRQWIEKADGDLLLAEHALSLGAEGPLDAICFHAQQCVEKYVKAVLTLVGIESPKTHDIEEVVARLPDPEAVDLTAREQRRLTRYATVMRYPGDYEPITLDEARAAVEMARRARASLRRLLPLHLACD